MSKWRAVLLVLSPFWAATLMLCLLVPIYTDEFQWKFMQARYWVDGFKNIRVMSEPSCGPYLLSAPGFMMPFRYIDALLYLGASPLWLRVAGVLTELLWLLIAVTLLRAALARMRITLPAAVVWIALASLLTLGKLPFLLELNRPEQPLVIAVTLALLAPFLLDTPLGGRRAGLAAALLIADAAWAFSAHPRGVYFTPVFVVALWLLVGPLGARLLSIAPVLAMAGLAAQNWNARLVCPGNPAITAGVRDQVPILAINSMPPAQAVAFIVQHLYWAMQTFHKAYAFIYAYPTFFSSDYMSFWQGQGTTLQPAERVVDAVLIVLLPALWLTVGLVIVAMFVRLLRRRPVPRAFHMLWATALGIGGLMFTQVTKAFYESSLALPLLFLLSALGVGMWWSTRPPALAGARPARAWAGALAVLVAVAMLSQAALLARYVPVATGQWRQSPYIAGEPLEIPLSLRPGAIDAAVLQAAQLCRIAPSPALQHLVVDEVTYAPFAYTSAPYFITYLTGAWAIGVPDLLAELKDNQSAGVIAGCDRLPPDLLGLAKRDGPFCCVSFL